MAQKSGLMSPARIAQMILIIRGEKVMLDSDLASLYQVRTKALLQAVKRNRQRFPSDFIFRLTRREWSNLRSHGVTSSFRLTHGGRRYTPVVFTEHGVAMLSSVLRSQPAVAVNIAIMRAFVRMRQNLVSHAELREKINRLERKYDSRFKLVFDALRTLMSEPSPQQRAVGFRPRTHSPDRDASPATLRRRGVARASQ